MEKFEKGRAGKADLIGLAKSGFWGGLTAGEFSGFWGFGGFLSGLIRLSIGLVTASSRF